MADVLLHISQERFLGNVTLLRANSVDLAEGGQVGMTSCKDMGIRLALPPTKWIC